MEDATGKPPTARDQREAVGVQLPNILRCLQHLQSITESES